MIYRNIKKAIFGFSDKKTGEKLRKFFKKHTGKDIDFNSIEHYSENFKLLAFDIPLKDFIPIGITAALVCPGLKFHGPVEEFISWYENKYLIFKDVEIIKHIPHASVEFPNIYKGVEHLVFGKNYKRDNYKMSDLFVDELFSNIPGVEVKAKYSRLYCDVEKYKDNSKEEMARFGQGYIYTKNYLGEEYIRHKKINKVDIDKDVDSYYDEHHKKLTQETKRIIKSGKKVLILDLHSFNEEQAIAINKEGPFPDICIGINENVDKKILYFIIDEIKKKGYSYQINYPYSGSIIPNDLNKTELKKVCSIMIEVNKKLYL